MVPLVESLWGGFALVICDPPLGLVFSRTCFGVLGESDCRVGMASFFWKATSLVEHEQQKALEN